MFANKPFFKFVSIALLGLSLVSCGPQNNNESSLDFYSADSYEAQLTYRTYFDFPAKLLKTPLKNISSYTSLSHADKIAIGKALKLHILHLYGVFTYQNRPTPFDAYSGSIMEQGKHKVNTARLVNKNYLRVSYDYTDRAVFYKDLFTGKNTEISFFMPTSPLEIYEKGFPKKPRRLKDGTLLNTCTYKGDPSKEAFWYYWSPDRKGCPKTFRRYLHMVKAKLTLLPQTKRTYPEYRKLYAQKRGPDGRGRLRIDLLMGPDEDYSKPRDLGRFSFEYTYNFLKKMRNNSGSTFKVIKNTSTHKLMRYSTDLFDANVHIHYQDPDAEGFPTFAAKVLRYSDIFIYSGHSYEGHYFSLQRLFSGKARYLPTSKYQIMFFNACTTYSYYNFNYFKAKKTIKDPRGTKNLDIMTNGIGAPFLLDAGKNRKTIVTTDLITIASLLAIKLDGSPLKSYRSWQEILQRVASNAGFDYTGLTNVMGDEDNPKQPPKLPSPKPL